MGGDAFERIVEHVLREEGGYVNHPRDPGGETNFGISRRAYPGLDIRRLTREDAKAIYRRDYWQAVRGDDLPFPVAAVVMDAAVNQGVAYARRALQTAVGATPDGVLGPRTLAAVKAAGPERTAVEILADRALRYTRHPDFSTFGLGWFRRLFRVAAVAFRSP